MSDTIVRFITTPAQQLKTRSSRARRLFKHSGCSSLPPRYRLHCIDSFLFIHNVFNEP